jgi:hypothetical protein
MIVRCHVFAPKKPRLAARKIAPTGCLQFAARRVGGVNVRRMRKSQVERKCPTQCRISCRTTRHPAAHLSKNASQATELTFDFQSTAGKLSRRIA